MKSPPWLLATPGELEAQRIVTLDPVESRHVSGALRRRTGDEIVLTDGLVIRLPADFDPEKVSQLIGMVAARC